MSKGIKKIKCIKNGWTLQRFQLKDRLVITPDRDVLFEIEEWGKGTTDDDKKKLMLSIIPSGSPLKRELYVTSPFGVRVHPISGAKKEHHGIDLRVNIGDGVFSPAIGRVSFAGVRGGYGNTVIVDHMYGFQTLYGHLSKLHVQAGEIVGKGKLLAEGGNSGSSTGPHLHYEIRYNGTPIDPKNFIDWNEKQFNILFEKERSVQWEYFLTVMGKN